MRIIHSLLLNLLVAFTVFILFFLVFEHRIVVPPALQVFGRAHPLFLHFPIVLLVLVWVLACFGHRVAFPSLFTGRLVYAMLFASAWTAAVTVVAGLLLAQEGGYDGARFQWHKWMGIALYFLSIALLVGHRFAADRSGRFRAFFKTGLSAALIVLVGTGHFGAALTHGEDYLFEPMRATQQRALNPLTAIVYTDLVHPILAAKCLNCHNNGKSKGGLVLADTASIRRGGDSGPALGREVGAESLIVERLLLDLEHEHRMPPKGKPQLAPTELALIQAWIASGADFTTPLAALPLDDTIRRLAAALYDFAGDTYDFPAADAAVVKSLNTPYRVVRPIDRSSPALSVSFFNGSFYTDRSLGELAGIRQQVVSMTLSGMPLAAADRNVLGTFTSLRDLALNGTPVDDTWCGMLSGLPKLRTLSLSGTSLTEMGLAELLSAPGLRSVYVWNTAVDSVEVEKLRQKHSHVRIELGYMDDGRTVLPLNDPVISPASTFFRDSLWVKLDHPVPGVELRYTLDGSSPDSVHSPVYRELFLVSDAVSVRVKGYKPGWISSGEASRAFHRARHYPTAVDLLTVPDPRYKSRGAQALYDLESGGSNHADGKWLGFHGKPMVAALSFDTAIPIDTVGVSVKQDYRSHIYPPERVELWGGPDSADATLIAQFRPKLTANTFPTRVVAVPVGGQALRYLRVDVKPFVPIPDGYPAAGNPAWVFIDEIIIR